VIIADTSALLALFNSGDQSHAPVSTFVAKTQDSLVVSPFVIAELDYLVGTRLGVPAELAVLRELASGAYDLPVIAADDLLSCAEIVDRYNDQKIGVTDASLVVLAKRFQTKSILTLDHRHFNVLRPLDGGRFKLLPS
jgi:uncharacterized protein